MNYEQIHGVDWRTKGAALFNERLLVRPVVHPDESFLGYRLRVAAANGLSNPNWLNYAENSLPKTHGIARWCPHCLAESDCYWRENWYSGPAACFEHRCWLTSSCNGCHRILRWKRIRFANCTCAAPLQDAPATIFSTELQRLIADRADSNAGTLSVGERWNLARFLGALAQFGLQGKPLKKATRQTENVEQLLVTAGASLIADQSACFDLLDRLRSPQAGENNVPLLSQVFPRLLTMLRRQLHDAERGWMVNLLEAYVAISLRHGSVVLWERKGAAGQADEEPHKRQKTRNPAIANMLAQTGSTVPVRRTRSGRQKFVISRADLQRLRTTQRSLIPLKAAARYAGMSTRRIEALAKAGLIASTGTRIDTRSIDRLLGSIVATCVEDAPLFDDPVSLADILRLYVPVEASVAFFNGLLNGTVRLGFGPDKVPALREIFADRGEVVSATQARVESDRQISIVEAARRLGVKQEVMYHLINIGLIRTRMGKLRRRAARVVDVDDLQMFTEQFLPLSTVAKTIGISASEAPGWARQHGIEIVTGPSVDGGRQYWIRKPVGAEISLR
ncbi:hypothetical protein B0G75_102418 [Paraburkholderia sp. BL18I3N2]|uniref:hypothetical protein n=1 Tax=Paraburkholderia sp. BL18I3N2 TaxID=1938799 RepID=UPI000D45FB95|nr:hypothetical protein [Paraburkholderia sp. BL18I3N2]PRX34386.1 hypothetical protein B0G75_102418 [Paraburkholderia sp. BL18I3N2]